MATAALPSLLMLTYAYFRVEGQTSHKQYVQSTFSKSWYNDYDGGNLYTGECIFKGDGNSDDYYVLYERS